MSKKLIAAARTIETTYAALDSHAQCAAPYPWLSRVNASMAHALASQRKRDTAAEPLWLAYEAALTAYLLIA